MTNLELINARKFAGISQQRLAELLGVCRRTVVRMEQGLSRIPPIDYHKLFDTLIADREKRAYLSITPTPAPVAPTPVVTPPPAPTAATPKPAKRDWTNRPFKEFQKDVLKIAVELSNKQESFDVPDVMASWLRVWRKDETKIDDAWQYAFSMLRYLEMQDEFLVTLNLEEKDHAKWVWALTPKGWETFEKRYMDAYCDEDEPTAREKYPNAFNRLFGDLV